MRSRSKEPEYEIEIKTDKETITVKIDINREINVQKMSKCKLLCSKLKKEYANCEINTSIYHTKNGNILITKSHSPKLFSKGALLSLLYGEDSFYPAVALCYSIKGEKIYISAESKSDSPLAYVPEMCAAVLAAEEPFLSLDKHLRVYIGDRVFLLSSSDGYYCISESCASDYT